MIAQPEVPAVSPEYVRARRLTALSALALVLFVAAGARLSKLPYDLELPNPGAVTLTILMVLVYATIRLAIEWRQTPYERRRVRAARVDPLCAAAAYGHAAVVSALLRAGADPRLVGGDGKMPEDLAAGAGFEHVVQEIMRARARRDTQ